MRIKAGFHYCRLMLVLVLLLGLAACDSNGNVRVYDHRQEAEEEISEVIGQEGTGAVTEDQDNTVAKNGDQGNTGAGVAGKENMETEEVHQGSIPMEGVTQETYEATVYVQVSGAVCTPGVYRVASTARVFEAVEAAGGFAEEACMEAVNLARTVTDEMMIYIPTKEEVAKTEKNYEDFGDTGGAVQGNRNKEPLEKEDQKTRVNINTASKEELMTLPGVGEARAEAILLYRREHGAFKDISEIMNVSGIKQAAFDKIRERITI